MSLGKQATSLAIMHAADVLQPLIVLPYAAAVLGPEHFGQYAYAMSIGQLAATVTDYGFHWTAQRAAATMRDDDAAIANLYARVTLTKICLFTAVVLLCVAATGHVLSLSLPLLACTLLAPLGGILFPAWLMIGLECAWRAAIASVAARVLALLAFFLLVNAPDHIARAVATQAAIPLVTGVLALSFILPIGFRGFRSISLTDVIDQLRSGWRGFLYSIVERALAVLPVPIIEHFAGYAAAGQYALAEKFVSATRPVFRVILETFSPRIAYHAKHAPADGVRLICRASATLLVGAAMSIGLFLVGPLVIRAVFGEGFAGAIPILHVLSIMPLLLNANVVMSNFYLFNFGHERAWAGLTVVGLLVFLACAYILSQGVLDPTLAVAAAVIARECVVLAVSSGYFIAFGLPLLMADLGADWKAEPRKAPRT
jgi:O-antigen/teichoic acid export membrane protein